MLLFYEIFSFTLSMTNRWGFFWLSFNIIIHQRCYISFILQLLLCKRRESETIRMTLPVVWDTVQPKYKWTMWSKYKAEDKIVILVLSILSEFGLGGWMKIWTVMSQIRKAEIRTWTMAVSTNTRLQYILPIYLCLAMLQN